MKMLRKSFNNDIMLTANNVENNFDENVRK